MFTTAAHRGVHFHCGLVEWDEAAPLRHHHLLRTMLPSHRSPPILTRASRLASLRVEDWRARCAARDIPLLLWRQHHLGEKPRPPMVELLPEENKRVRWLTREEARKLEEALPDY